jgi:hypothetical protein
MNRNHCCFLTPLDTTLRVKAAQIEPVLRFLALIQRHFVVSDSQIADHRFFRDEPLDRDLATLFERDSGDSYPLFVISKRDERPLREIVLDSLAQVGRQGKGKRPMHFSSLLPKAQSRLNELVRTGRLTPTTFFRDVGYPERFLKRITKYERSAGLSQELQWKPEILTPANYRSVLRVILTSNSLETQAALPRGVRSFFKETREQIAELDAATFSRTRVHLELAKIRQERFKNRQRSKIPTESFREAIEIVRAAAGFAYLRNFADWNDFALSVDRHYWLPSSVINKELGATRPQVEQADSMVEACLDIEDGFAGGTISASLRSMRLLLEDCGFSKNTSWSQIVELRSRNRFWDNLDEIDTATGEAQALALKEHVVWCLRQLLRNEFDWTNFSIDAVSGVGDSIREMAIASAGAVAAALGFATGSGGVAVLTFSGRGFQKAKQAILIDEIGTKVAAEARRRDNTKSSGGDE